MSNEIRKIKVEEEGIVPQKVPKKPQYEEKGLVPPKPPKKPDQKPKEEK